MIRKLIPVLMLLPALAAADVRYRSPDPTSVIEDSMCIPELNGEGYLHVDEDVSGLIISVVGSDGVEVALYDAGTEIEDVAAPGTGAYTAPSTDNVRVSPDGNGGDCTEMQFADAVYDSQEWVVIRVSDGQTTILDFERFVYMDGITLSQIGDQVNTQMEAYGGSGLIDEDDFNARSTTDPATATAQTAIGVNIDNTQTDLETLIGVPNDDLAVDIAAIAATVGSLVLMDTTIATLDSQISFTLTDGSPDNDAYANGKHIVIVDAETANQKAVGEILDYDGSTKTVTLRFDPGVFTMAVGDTVYILSD